MCLNLATRYHLGHDFRLLRFVAPQRMPTVLTGRRQGCRHDPSGWPSRRAEAAAVAAIMQPDPAALPN